MGIRWSLIVLLCALTQGPQVWGSGLEGHLRGCYTLKDSGKRLECYDALARGPETVEPKQVPVVPSNWQAYDRQDPHTKQHTVAALLAGEQDYQDSLLVVRCSGGELRVFVYWNFYLEAALHPVTRRKEPLQITYSIDAVEDVKVPATLSEDRSTAYLEADVKTLLRQLEGARQLRVIVAPTRSKPAVATFMTSGIDRATAPVLKACGG